MTLTRVKPHSKSRFWMYHKPRNWRLLVCILLLTPFFASVTVQSVEQSSGSARLLTIDGPIGPATSAYISEGLGAALDNGDRLVIIEMDTPGGLDTSMRAIIRDIIASPVPVASYVSPSGARAASAGTYILYASHIAAMAPGTNLGAATPVQLGGPGPLPGSPDSSEPDSATDDKEEAEADDEAAGQSEAKPAMPKDPMKSKVVNDAAAYIRSLADMRGRNAEWAESAVRQAASLPANEALEKNVVDIVATSIDDLLDQADGREVTVRGENVTLATSGSALVRHSPSWQTELLSVITNPNVAFMLMLVGVYGLIFELANPGATVPGVIGAISLLLGLYALHVLPVNYAGLGLVLLGLILMVAEAFVPSFGILGIGGLVAFAIGATLLFDTEAPGFGLSWEVIATTTAISGLIMIVLLAYIVRAHRRPVSTGREQIVTSLGTVESWTDGHGSVRVHSELWTAKGPAELQKGKQIRVTGIQGLTLTVEPVE